MPSLPLRFHLAILAFAFAAPTAQAADDAKSLAARLKAVGRDGAGQAEATEASRKLSALGPDALLDVLRAMDGARPDALNWLRAAADAIAERTVAAKKDLPVKDLETFLLDRSHAPRARRLAFELVAKLDPGAPDRLVPGFIDDPSVELRRDAVAREIDAAEKSVEHDGKEAGVRALQRVLDAARDEDQVERVAKKLEGLGEKPDMTRHYGFVTRWRIVGPFDNTAKKGFATAYPPEAAQDFSSELAGKTGPVRWKEHETKDPRAVVDLNALLGKAKGVIGYAAAEVESKGARDAQIRVGTFNALQVWLNGKLVFSRDEYHHGMSIDQYIAPVSLAAGKNTILIKVCQDEQKEEWTENWKFQLRVCDSTGGGLQ